MTYQPDPVVGVDTGGSTTLGVAERDEDQELQAGRPSADDGVQPGAADVGAAALGLRVAEAAGPEADNVGDGDDDDDLADEVDGPDGGEGWADGETVPLPRGRQLRLPEALWPPALRDQALRQARRDQAPEEPEDEAGTPSKDDPEAFDYRVDAAEQPTARSRRDYDDDDDEDEDLRQRRRKIEEEKDNQEYDRRQLVVGDDLDGDAEPEWLVEGVLVGGQLGVIGGPEKSLKTSLAVDLAVSLATETPFLGRYTVPAPCRVLFISCESDQQTILRTVRRIMAARGLSGLPKNIAWRFEPLPLADEAGAHRLAYLAVAVANDGRMDAAGPPVIIVDPAYLNLGGEDGPPNMTSMFDAGQRIRRVLEWLDIFSDESYGLPTLLFVHHSNRALKLGVPMRLRDLSFAGLNQLTRQWLLLNRRQPYQSDGKHDLVMTVGGSAGHSSVTALTVDEGPAGDNGLHTTWNVTVDAYAQAAPQKDATAHPDDAAARKKVMAALTAVLTESKAQTAPYNAILKRSRLSSKKMKAVTDRLVADGVIEITTATGESGKKGRIISLLAT
jgi:hypothetical protein